MSIHPSPAPTQDALRDLLSAQQAYAPRLRRQDAKARIAKLKKMQDYLDRPENLEALVDALQQDFRKPRVETLTSEVGTVLNHIRYVSKRLKRWMEPEKLPTPLALTGTRSYVYKEPKGAALIIAPWNYPINLTLIPLVYAIAAGCTAVVKPSEFTVHTTEFMRVMLAKLFDDREVAVVTGGGEVSAFLTTLPFDHIFFTGSPAIGKKVMAAAAQNLTSVTLELGGKSPAIVDPSVNIKKSAENTIWGKCFNAGQTCIAPDYLLVDEAIADRYVAALSDAVARFYGDAPQTSDSLARIVNERHFDRLKGLLDDAIAKGATVVQGGSTDRAQCYVEPTILTDVTEEMAIMQEEIFGPLLPVMTYKDLDEAVMIINRREKALAFYVQSNRRSTVQKLLAGTSSGGALVNEYLLGASNAAIPFGGVNNSGIGKSFGYHGFVEFTNERSVLERRFLDLSIAYPPYTDKVKGIVEKIYRWL